MLSTFLHFHFGLWRHYFLPQLFRREFISEDERHPLHCHYRRYGKRYQKKRKIVLKIWTLIGVVVIIFPALPLVLSLLLATTFLAFSILDETE